MSATNTTRSGDYELQPVKFSRLARRGVLFGLTASQLVVVGIGVVTLVFSLYVGGGTSLVVALPVIVCCSALAWVSVRSEERRLGKGCVSTCSSRGSPYH